MLNNNTSNEKLQRDERQGKMLLHTEFSLLSLLRNENGVIQQRGLFSVSGRICNLRRILFSFRDDKIRWNLNFFVHF